MISIKLRNKEGKVKYISKPDGFPVKVNEYLVFKWDKRWQVVSVKEKQRTVNDGDKTKN